MSNYLIWKYSKIYMKIFFIKWKPSKSCKIIITICSLNWNTKHMLLKHTLKLGRTCLFPPALCYCSILFQNYSPNKCTSNATTCRTEAFSPWGLINISFLHAKGVPSQSSLILSLRTILISFTICALSYNFSKRK